MEAAMTEHTITPATDDIAKFLDMLANKIGQVHLVVIDPDGRHPLEGRDFGRHDDVALQFAIERNMAGRNIYWSVNQVRPGLHKKPTKADIISGRFAHVDIDPPKDGSAFNKSAELAKLEKLPCRPTFVIDSGGGIQAFWYLAYWGRASLLQLERANRQIRDQCGGDNCQNIDRVMRVPGTVNWPDPRKRERGRVPVVSTIMRGWDHAGL
jgi:hypothetical protein